MLGSNLAHKSSLAEPVFTIASPNALGKWYVAVLLILGLISLIPIFKIQADPPYAGWANIYCDEGFHLYAARNHTLFGTWILPEEHTTSDHSPWVKFPWSISVLGLFFLLPHTVLNALVFGIFGTGLLQSRLLSMFEGILSVWLLFFAVSRQRGQQEGFAAAVLLGTNFIQMISSRTGQAYALLNLLAVLVFICSDKARSRFGYAALAGFLCYLLYITHLTALYVAGIFLVSYGIWSLSASKESEKTNCWWQHSWMGFLLVFLLSLAAWCLLYLLPNKELVGPYYREVSPSFIKFKSGSSGLFASLAQGLKERNFMLAWEKFPFVAFLGGSAAALQLGVGSRRLGCRFSDFFCAVWLIGGTLFITLQSTVQVRYFSTLLIPFSVLAGWLIMNARGVRESFGGISLHRRGWTLALLVLVNWIFVSHYAAKAFWLSSGLPSLVRQALAICVSVAGAFLVSGIILKGRWLEGMGKWIILGLVLISSLVAYGKYLRHATTFTWDQNQVLKRYLKEGDTVVGSLAPTLVLESRAKALSTFNAYYNPPVLQLLSDAIIQRMGITHLLIVSKELGDYSGVLPHVMANAKQRATIVFHPTPEAQETKYLLFAVRPEYIPPNK